MILDGISNADLYARLAPRMVAGLEWLRAMDPSLGEGRYEIDGGDLFALVQSYETTPAFGKLFESHRRFADIQYVVSGRERLLHTGVEGLVLETPYDEERDIAFYAEPGASSSLLLRSGDFSVLFPDDAHKPGCMAGGRESVKKVVVKVLL